VYEGLASSPTGSPTAAIAAKKKKKKEEEEGVKRKTKAPGDHVETSLDKVRKAPCRPGSWANITPPSLLSRCTYSRRSARASLHLLAPA
jgi:hypothetical protein